jgi:alpha-mannosidase
MATEEAILSSLGIDDPQTQSEIVAGTKRLLILDASAHLDWDWLLPFPVLAQGGSGARADWYFSGETAPVAQILTAAATLLAQSGYHYSICEIGFLRAFAAAQPAEFATLLKTAQANGNLRIAGGGITSPDNLLTHGEAFIRSYLLGHCWLAENCPGLPAPVSAWLPDDFGHDPQLPVVVEAMGLSAAGFERVPGYGPPDLMMQTVSGGPSLATVLTGDKIDFVWTAADGSSIVAHWLIGGYGLGNGLTSTANIESYLGTALPPSPTPYVYVPVLTDFSLPNKQLLSVVEQWNGSGGSYDGTVVVAACGSFEDYAQLVAFHAGELDADYGPQFDANPYFTGCYGSRPELKILHQRATRNLLATELFGIVAGWARAAGGTAASGTGLDQAQLLLEAWNLLVPSTHHDYIPGTAIPDVFHSEQTTLLRAADARAEWLLRDALETIAGAVDANGSGPAVVVFNPLGFARTELVELGPKQVVDASIDCSGPGYQASSDGGLLFVATAPSLGYQTAYLTSQTDPDPPAQVDPRTNPVTSDEVTLTNGLVQATLTRDPQGIWSLSSVVDGATGKPVLAAGELGNQLLFYCDGGTEYRFGMEFSSQDPRPWGPQDVSGNLSEPTIEILESGPLRVWVRTTVTYRDDQSTIVFTRDYQLVADEPLLRMRSSGAAPMLDTGVGYHGSSVVVAFPLAAGTSGIESVTRGTPYHWTDVMPEIYWDSFTFLPTHGFAIPSAGGSPLCALYHADVPGWGLSNTWNTNTQSFDPNDGVLYGCLWRNGDGNYFSWVYSSGTPLADGTDPETHVREYALRMPSSLAAPESGGPLREALAYATPLRGLPAAPWSTELPDSLSLASSSDQRALVTAVKQGSVNAGDVVLRIYQPTNAGLTATLTLDSHLAAPGTTALAVRGQTALEQDLDPEAETALALSATSDTITFTAGRALTTLAVTPTPSPGRPPDA